MPDAIPLSRAIEGSSLVQRAREEAERIANLPPEERHRLHAEESAVPREIDQRRKVRTFLYVPERFAAEDFDTFVPKTDKQGLALKVAKRWAAASLEGRAPMLALVGPTGCGKSHLLYAAIQALHRLRPTTLILCRPWYRLADQLRYGGPELYKGSEDVALLEPGQLRAQVFCAKAFAIDEIVKTSNTDFDDTEMVKITHHAWDERLPVIITTRVHPLADLLGPATASRFDVVVMDGPDARQEA